MTARDVVVTGVGCLGAFGIGPDALAAALARGEPCASAIDRSAGYHRRHAAALVADCRALDLDPLLPPSARRMSALSRFAVAAARLAIADAGLASVRGDRTAVALATALGPGGFTEQLCRQILEQGGKSASPFLFTDCVANAPAGQVAIDLGARGGNLTICQREAGPVLALAQGAAEIRSGRADVCLAGAADEMSPLVHAVLDRFRALARATADRPEEPRPFARSRNGLLVGEGACLLVLEAEPHARARGARVLARLGPCVRAFDPTAGRASFGRDAAGLAATLAERDGDQLPGVDVVVSSAAGSRAGDALEARVLRAVVPPSARIVAPKAVHGEYGGGTLAAALLALRGAVFALPPGGDDPDPALGIRLADGTVRARRVLLTGLAAGGAAAWTFLEAP
jgi:3-oxoacyl-[acyl-carrier-protein] synthase II